MFIFIYFFNININIFIYLYITFNKFFLCIFCNGYIYVIGRSHLFLDGLQAVPYRN